MRFLLMLLPVIPLALLAQAPAAKSTTKTTTSSTKTAAKRTTKSTTTKKSTATKAGASKTGTATASAKGKAKSTAAKTMTDEQKTIYALGLSVQRSLAQFDLSTAEVEILKQAILDGNAGKPAVDINEFGPKLQPLASARAARVADRVKAESQVYLAKAAAEPGAVKTATGLVYRDTTPGTGESPKASDTVKVHYRGTLPDGTEFDSSYKRNQPTSFPLSGVIRCWTEGVQLMKVGGKATLVCPSDIAYGDSGSPPTIPGGATLVFEIELLGIGGE